MVPWDWVIVDLSYVLVVIGGAMIFRARNVSIATWMTFGFFATLLGSLLFYFTADAQAAFQEAGGGVSAMVNSGFEC